MDLSLQGKTAVICGSSQGLGLAIAQELALLGASCILLARNKEKLHAAVNSLEQTSDQKHSFKSVDFFKNDMYNYFYDQAHFIDLDGHI